METLIAYYNNGFLKAVAQAKKSDALPLYIVVEDYPSKDNLPYTSHIPQWTENVMQEVLNRADLFDELTTDISDLRYALKQGEYKRLSIFYRDQEPDAIQKLKDAESYLKLLRLAILDCKRMLDSGKDTTPNGVSVAEACEKALVDSVPLDKVAALKLTRIYPTPTP